MRVVGGLVLLVALVALASAAPAGAAEVSMHLLRTEPQRAAGERVMADVHRLVLVAAPGEANRLDVAPGAGTAVVVRDDGAPLQAGAGCTAEPGRVVCVPPSRPGVAGRLQGTAIVLGDGDDSLLLRSPAFSLTLPADLVSAGPGNDVVQVLGAESHAQVAGGPGADEIVARDGAQVRATYAERAAPVRVTLDDVADDGEAGEGDRVGSGVTTVVGGAGDDVLVAERAVPAPLPTVRDGVLLAGGGGADQLLGSPRDDRLEGGDGADLLLGADGDDELDGGAGPDVLGGGGGVDLADYGSRAQPVAVQAGTGPDDGEAGEGDDVRDDIERLRGGAGADDLRGGPGPQELDGGPGDDHLDGGPGDDRLLASDGNDRVVGGPGRDLVFLRSTTRLALRDGESDGLACGGPLLASSELDDADRLSRSCRPQLELVSRIVRAGRDGWPRALVRCPRAVLSCRAALRLRGASGAPPTLAVASDVILRGDGRRRLVALRLTRAGRRLGGGVRRARLTIRGFNRPFAPERAVRLLLR